GAAHVDGVLTGYLDAVLTPAQQAGFAEGFAAVARRSRASTSRASARHDRRARPAGFDAIVARALAARPLPPWLRVESRVEEGGRRRRAARLARHRGRPARSARAVDGAPRLRRDARPDARGDR